MNYYERKAAGICARCNNPATHGVYCESCAEKNSAEKKKLYLESKKNYDCVKCGKPTWGKAHCDDCLKMIRVKQKQRYMELTDEQKMRKRIYNREWLEKNPDKKALYLERQRERNRRYENV